MRSRIIAALAATAALFGVAALPSAAVQAPAPKYSAAALAPDNSVDSSAIIDGQVWGGDIADAEENYLRSTPANSVWTSSLNNWVVTEDKLHPAVQRELSWGSLANGPADIPETAIAKIGGPFLDNATLLGSVDLPAGDWLVNTSAVFTRIASGAAGTRPQLALRYNATQGNPYGLSAGTLMGAEISPTMSRELTESASEYVHIAEPTQMSVFGFGYNDDQSAAGGGQITVKARITLLRVGIPSVG